MTQAVSVESHRIGVRSPRRVRFIAGQDLQTLARPAGLTPQEIEERRSAFDDAYDHVSTIYRVATSSAKRRPDEPSHYDEAQNQIGSAVYNLALASRLEHVGDHAFGDPVKQLFEDFVLLRETITRSAFFDLRAILIRAGQRSA